jgi:two-component system cell cycle sensor histidine kinase/response regulator CckA
MMMAAATTVAAAVLSAAIGAASGLAWRRRRIDLLRRALDIAPDAQLILAPGGAVAYANTAFHKLFQTAAGLPLARFVAALGDGDGSAGFARLRASAAAGERASAMLNLRDPDGRDAGWFDVAVGPISGRPGYSFWHIADITARRGMAEALRDECDKRERFQRLFADAPVGIALTDRAGRFVEANRALGHLLGAAPPGLIGEELTGLVAEDCRTAIAAALAAAAAGEVSPPIEMRLNERDKICVVFLSRLDGGEGGDGELMLHFIDVTARKSLEAQVAQAQKMQAIGQLAGGIAHDFNNLLTAMIGFCDLLLTRFRPGDPPFADIMQIKQNANRAANLVRQLLAFSRRQSLRPRILDIADVLIELSHLLRRLIGERVELELVHGREPGLAKVDQGQLEQVIINLAVNARDAMPGGGTLTIRTDNVRQETALRRDDEIMPAGDYVLIEVADTGTGIAREDLPRIFEPFFSTKETGSGTGLGLSTVYGIVRQTGGFIFVDSAPGQGAAFRVYLPRHMTEAELPARPAMTARPRDLTGVGTVLLVEDEDPVRMFGGRALRNKGYTVIEAKSGEDALAQIDGASRIDLLVTDVVMPGIDGPALARAMRERRPDLKIIFISGYAEDEFRQSLGRDGDIHFLPKPFSLTELAGKVKEAIGGAAD